MKLNVTDKSTPAAIAREVERNCVSLNPDTPVKLPAYLSTALPSASASPQSLIYVADTNKVAVSVSGYWYPLTLGTHY